MLFLPWFQFCSALYIQSNNHKTATCICKGKKQISKTKKDSCVLFLFFSGSKGAVISFGNNFGKTTSRKRRVVEQKEYKLQNNTRKGWLLALNWFIYYCRKFIFWLLVILWYFGYFFVVLLFLSMTTTQISPNTISYS